MLWQTGKLEEEGAALGRRIKGSIREPHHWLSCLDLGKRKINFYYYTTNLGKRGEESDAERRENQSNDKTKCCF